MRSPNGFCVALIAILLVAAVVAALGFLAERAFDAPDRARIAHLENQVISLGGRPD